MTVRIATSDNEGRYHGPFLYYIVDWHITHFASDPPFQTMDEHLKETWHARQIFDDENYTTKFLEFDSGEYATAFTLRWMGAND